MRQHFGHNEPFAANLSPRGRSLIVIRHYADMCHHSAVFVFQNMAVIDEVAELGERDFDHDRCHVACTAAPRSNGSIAGRTTVINREIVHQCAGFVAASRRWLHYTKPGLVYVKVVVFAGHVDQFPGLLHGLVAGRQREANGNE